MVFIIGRVLTVLAWKYTLLRGRDSHYSAIFMFFNCMQWVLYLGLYFWLMDNLKIKYSQRTFPGQPVVVDSADRVQACPDRHHCTVMAPKP